MRSVEAEGESIDAAIEIALNMLGVTRDRVEVEIVSNASRGVFGIGARKARVRATLRQPISEQILDEAAATNEAALENLAEPDLPPRPRGSRRPPRPDARRRLPAEPQQSPRQTPDAAAAQRAEDALRNIVQYMGIEAQVRGRIEGESIVLDLTGDSSGVLIGRKGQMLDALEYLVSRIVSRDQASAVRVVIDCERYRERRREALEEMARRMADEAKRRNRTVKMNAMSPRDRRIVHLVLQRDASITTRSSGKGHFRKLIIIPRAGVGSDDSTVE